MVARLWEAERADARQCHRGHPSVRRGRGDRSRPSDFRCEPEPGPRGPSGAGAALALTAPGAPGGTSPGAVYVRPPQDGDVPAGTSSQQGAAPTRPGSVGAFYGQGRDGGVGIGAVGQVTINLGSARVAARSAYLQQVRRIAPPDPPGLVGREAELAELARFCLEPDLGSYMWWRAGPWAGESALMSTFVLHPPPEVRDRVRITSFFITARLAAQDTREAFSPRCCWNSSPT